MSVDDAHLSELEIARYLEQQLDRAGRDRIEDHLAGCASCRMELVQVKRLVETAPHGRRFVRLAAALAGVAAVVLLMLRPVEPVQLPDGVRGPDALSGPPPIMVVEPRSGRRVPVERITFAWRGLAAGGSYAFELVDATGSPVYAEMLLDTVLVLPPHVRLESATTYFWHVDALSRDGSMLTTRMQRLDTR